MWPSQTIDWHVLQWFKTSVIYCLHVPIFTTSSMLSAMLFISWNSPFPLSFLTQQATGESESLIFLRNSIIDSMGWNANITKLEPDSGIHLDCGPSSLYRVFIQVIVILWQGACFVCNLLQTQQEQGISSSTCNSKKQSCNVQQCMYLKGFYTGIFTLNIL